MTESAVPDDADDFDEAQRQAALEQSWVDRGRPQGITAEFRRTGLAAVVDDRLDEPPLVRPLGRMPVAIPADIEDRSLSKASGVVTLPDHIAWSPPYEYDLDDRRDLRGAYARVMTEGLDSDVRYYIDVDTLVEVWDELYLSPHVRERWGAWLAERGLIG